MGGVRTRTGQQGKAAEVNTPLWGALGNPTFTCSQCHCSPQRAPPQAPLPDTLSTPQLLHRTLSGPN